MWIHSETHRWHDKKIQSNAPYRYRSSPVAVTKSVNVSVLSYYNIFFKQSDLTPSLRVATSPFLSYTLLRLCYVYKYFKSKLKTVLSSKGLTCDFVVGKCTYFLYLRYLYSLKVVIVPSTSQPFAVYV